ncbi:uncharacterized protein TM35_000361590 [Trypanosoma theileri]|uniref:Uncharacterized protein n=1 Tax=Trypanosoma theileri TaxID=67003 RepID=A0A1X0NMC3_9TRYP|nr:uncharacterized protein TM35_000361590 [Trypanosoma theileri]ORC85299.1 hypothetical protein TM35_000361590 [Trypanosoma theileri]
MTISPLAFAWVSAHLKRRGLPCKDDIKPVNQFEHSTKTVQSESFTTTVSSSSSSYNNNNNDNNNNDNNNDSKIRNSLPPRDEILALLGHRLLSSEPARLVTSQEVDDVMKGKERRRNNSSNGESENSNSNPQRNSPQRVASGVIKFVEQQMERVSVMNGSAHACFVLHTVLTACVRHALRFSRMTASTSTTSTSTSNHMDNTLDKMRDEVLASPHIDFTWSRKLAAEHLVEVARDAAVQKKLRSLLWKTVDKEHKRILQAATTLYREKVDEMMRFGVDESEVQQLFGIPKEVVNAAHDLLRACTSIQDIHNYQHQSQQLLSFSSDRHFSFISSSPQFASFLKEWATTVSEQQYHLLQRGRREELNTLLLSSSPEEALKQQWISLFVDMVRVRMAVGVLLQFEILARRCATVGKEQKKKEKEKEKEEEEKLKEEEGDILILAQELCSLATTAGSRALETPHHLKRFSMFFRISVQSIDGVERNKDLHAIKPPYSSLKSVFAAMSLAEPNMEKEFIPHQKKKKKKNKDKKNNSDILLDSSLSSEKRETETIGPQKKALLMEDDLLMQTIMSLRPPGDNNHNSLNTPTNTSSTLVKKVKKANKSSVKDVEKIQSSSPITWHFRCCTSPTGASFNATTAIPCGTGERKVELLRPSRYVPWPFTLEAIVKNENKNVSEFNHNHNDNNDEANKNNKNTNSEKWMSVNLDKVPEKFTYPATGLTVWMRYHNPTWMTSTASSSSSFTSLDLQHTSQLQRLLEGSGGRLMSMNGCPAEKISSLMRIVRRGVRLVVRFR